MNPKFLSAEALNLNAGLLLLRLLGGGLMLSHGWMKLNNILSGKLEFGDPIGVGAETSLYLAVFAEFLCSLLVIVGIFTRIALIPLITTMLVAIFAVHANDPFQVKELAVMYLGIYVVLMLTGPGKYALDRKL